MDTAQIEDALWPKLDRSRIVFWNDPEAEFVDLIASPPLGFLDGVQVIRLDQAPSLEVKIRVERDDPEGRFLLYAPQEEPEYERDWLLDIRLYSESFRADRASIILGDLGLTRPSLREHIHRRRKFFDSKERVRKLQALISERDTEADLDRKMLAVATRAGQPQLFSVIRTLFDAFTDDDGEADLNASPAVWKQVERFDLDTPFWAMVKSAFGYEEQTPTLKNLLIRLMATDLAQGLRNGLPASLENLVLPGSGRSNAVVCLGEWRDSASRRASYDRLSALVGGLLQVSELLGGHEVEDLLDVMTFLEVEKVIIRGVGSRLVDTAETVEVDEVRRIANRRQAGHWLTGGAADSSTPREALRAVYGALIAAAELFDLKNRHSEGFDGGDIDRLYRAYESELYRFDQSYRHFCERADAAEKQWAAMLKTLRERVEACYTNWYLVRLSLAWDQGIADEEGRLRDWRIDGVTNQYRFYDEFVERPLNEGDYKRVFVIVSDALRYEAAVELKDELNGRYRFHAEAASMLGVVPSYTALGMASLLPHKTLSYSQDAQVVLNGQPTQGLSARKQVLAGVGGTAIGANELMAMRKEEGREFLRGQRVVYIYHDTIDAAGDRQASEGTTLHAVRQAIGELARLVGHVVNNLNGSLVMITADHGFLFTESSPDETGRSSLVDKPSGTIIGKRRYLLGKGLSVQDTALSGSTNETAGAEGGVEFWVPRGANRFHFAGGSRYGHGGAMPQEVIVPLVTVREREGKAAEKTRTKQVAVQVLRGSHKITTPRHRFELLQMEPVSDRVQPRTLEVAVYEGGDAVTNVEKVVFDSDSTNIDERRKWVSLVLTDREYDKRKPYRLVLRDAETGIEQQAVDVTIDRAFTDDF